MAQPTSDDGPDRRALDARVREIVALAEAIRCDPELSGNEHRAATRCTALLETRGFIVEKATAGLPTAFVARRRFGGGQTRVAFLAEYDALPGIGHGCGHHLIAAASVGAALAAAETAEESDDLEIQVIGTPSEETIGGKVVMAEAGVFDGLDGVMMFHAGHEWRTVTNSLACQSVEIVFSGRASHAVASPEAGINALEAMIDLFLAARELRARFGPKGVRLPGVILEGGVRANIVPDRAVARFSLRAPTSEEREVVVEALLGEVDRIAQTTGCRRLVRPVDNPYDEMRTNLGLAAALREELHGRGAVTNETPRTSMGSIDAGNVARRAPTVHAYLPAALPQLSLHTREFGEATAGGRCAGALATASEAMAATALRLARDPALRSSVRREHEAAPGIPLRRRWPLLTSEPEESAAC